MFSEVTGIVLFALGIALTIGLHEFGHLAVAQRQGMLVRRFAIGFGPTLLTRRRGETEYCLKLFPLGGYCDIAGMTTSDPGMDRHDPRAMVNASTAGRVATLLGGVVMNLVVAWVMFYALAVSSGLPTLDQRVVLGGTDCVAAQTAPGEFAPCSGPGPAAEAGLRAGDRVERINGDPVASWEELVAAIGAAHSAGQSSLSLTYTRGEVETTTTVDMETTTRLRATGRTPEGELITEPVEVGAIGITRDLSALQPVEYSPLSAVPAATVMTGEIIRLSAQGLASLPAKIPGVVASLFGAPRDLDSPISVVGASRVGGELARESQWPSFVLLLANLNVFLALFNLIPLPPLDGGHIALIGWERLRDRLRRARGLQPLGPVDYERIAPVTIGMTVLLVAFGVLVIGADVVNPITLFG